MVKSINLAPTGGEVLKFIARFTDRGRRREVIECFTEGCCWWFGIVLIYRFGGRMMYHPVDCHFAVKTGGALYDITGRLNDDGRWVEWTEVVDYDPILAERVRRECIEGGLK